MTTEEQNQEQQVIQIDFVGAKYDNDVCRFNKCFCSK
jgi:hypothetical protein